MTSESLTKPMQPYRLEQRVGMILILLVILRQSAALSDSSSPWLGRSLSVGKPTATSLTMVMSLPDKDTKAWTGAKKLSIEKFQQDGNTKRKVRKKYKRKRIPETERERLRISKEQQSRYEQIVSKAGGKAPSIWSFESLFPETVWDDATIKKDLFDVRIRDGKVQRERQGPKPRSKLKTSAIGASSMMRVWRDPKLSSFILPYDPPATSFETPSKEKVKDEMTDAEAESRIFEQTLSNTTASITESIAEQVVTNRSGKVDLQLTRMVEDSIYGYRRGTNMYETSLMGDGAVKFREGVRLGNPLKVNADRLNYHAKKELRHNNVEEAQELYEMAVRIDPRDGRAYLGLSRCAQRRRDFKLARECLRIGINNSASLRDDGTPDYGANPFLLQALGYLEEKSGHLSQAEALYIEAAKSRPYHAAAWVALGQLRTKKFRQGAAAGRVCYQAAERELEKAGLPPSSHVYTAWASMEYKLAGDYRRARNLYRLALKVDPKCSAAWLQLGVMEADNENWKEAQLCFETVLKFDQRNSRVLQAYAIMESKRPDSDNRKVIDLFERALKVNPRDGGVFQPYALFVAKLGDTEAARDLLQRGTEVNKRHAPLWQAWGVMETRAGNASEARNVFQQGIWACAQLGGGQSGGFNCARLWQAWGVLEAEVGDYPAARRCFSRALDADKRNIASIIAWTRMEEAIGNCNDARAIYERALKQFTAGTAEKKQIWRAYELMEQRTGNPAGAQDVYQRSMREAMSVIEESMADSAPVELVVSDTGADEKATTKKEKTKEIEVSRWDNGSTSMKGEIWFHNGSIEGKVPASTMNKKRASKR